ncbi:MAG: cell division protein SepF [Parolsenella sp.]|uniref:cell division protein SepF n=1 Tax=unclassified Parolsenella TaxID=2623992 RepID=UPI002A7513E5|nr:cell division protein SepF [Parolsenella sp.]MCI5949098.1 cell division protein SepF [Coriobacteriaceae bacterium]MDY3291713.1 cell division protein SepF [Parolsenella sp.]
MGFFDNIKDAVQDHLRPQDNRQDDYYEDEYDDYDEPYDGDAGYYDDAPQRGDRYADRGQQQQGSGLLGNPSRPDADSISVYTRSGRHLSGDDFGRAGDVYGSNNAYGSDGAYRAADDSWRKDDAAPRDFLGATHTDEPSSFVPPATQPGVFGATGNTPGDVGLTAVPRVTSGKLPAYVLKPTSYDDVQTVVRRVRTNQPVVLSFKNLKIEVAKRILDFSFGLACGIDGSVEELGDRVFVVLPQGVELSETDRAKLTREGLAR